MTQEDNTEGPVILVVGARPNFMKIAPLHAELQRRGVEQLLLHTGQHYDYDMSEQFFNEFSLPKPKYNHCNPIFVSLSIF